MQGRGPGFESLLLHQFTTKIACLGVFYDIIVFMDFTFDFRWMIGGLVIALAGGLIVIFYKRIADGLMNGVSSYEKVKLFGIIAIVIGLLITANLHIIVLEFLVGLMFGK